ncbi:hypothetical protein I3I95_01480 [bacterium]|nr:hypothetical protein [bacterium]
MGQVTGDAPRARRLGDALRALGPDAVPAALVGIGVFRFWYQYNLYNLHFLTDYGTEVAWINILRAAVIGMLLLCAAKADLPRRAQRALVWASLALMTASSVLFLLQMVTGDAALSVARCVVCAIGLVWGGAMWMVVYERLAPPVAFVSLAGGLALSCLLSLVAGFLPTQTMAFANLFVPAVAVVCYWYATSSLDAREAHAAVAAVAPGAPREVGAPGMPDDRLDGSRHRELVVIGASFCLFAFVMGVTLGFPDGESRALSQLTRSVHQLLLVAVLAWLVWWVVARGRALRFHAVWIVENALLIVSILLLVERNPALDELATATTLSAESFFYSFVFLTSLDAGRGGLARRSSLFVLGVLYGGSLASMGVGRVLSGAVGTTPMGYVYLLVMMSVLIVIETVAALAASISSRGTPLFADVTAGLARHGDTVETVAATLDAALDGGSAGNADAALAPVTTLRTRDAAGVMAGGASVSQAGEAGDGRPAPSIELVMEVHAARLGALEERRIEQLHASHGLTAVEADIVRLVLQGRDRNDIARILGYSANTIRNYTHDLYRKLGIHSKSELVAIVSDGAEVVAPGDAAGATTGDGPQAR